MISKELVHQLLERKYPRSGRRCPDCGHVDYHKLTYCYKCPGRYVDIVEDYYAAIRRYRDLGWNMHYLLHDLRNDYMDKLGIQKKSRQQWVEEFGDQFDRSVIWAVEEKERC